MHKNRIGGVRDRTSGREVAKSISVKGPGRKSGGCAPKAVGLTAGGLRRCPRRGTEGTERNPERGAGVSRRHSRWWKRAGIPEVHPTAGLNGPPPGDGRERLVETCPSGATCGRKPSERWPRRRRRRVKPRAPPCRAAGVRRSSPPGAATAARNCRTSSGLRMTGSVWGRFGRGGGRSPHDSRYGAGREEPHMAVHHPRSSGGGVCDWDRHTVVRTHTHTARRVRPRHWGDHAAWPRRRQSPLCLHGVPGG